MILSDRRISVLLFLSVFAALLLWHSSRLVLGTIDEGIILDASQRMAAGQRLYVDFFGYMSPGSYWIQEIVFRVFGASLPAARLPVLIDAAAQCALVFWLARRFVSRHAALVCAGLFLWLEIWDLRMLTAQHRFDSATLALAAICCLHRRSLFASGALAAAATVCTPSLAILCLVLSAFICVHLRLISFFMWACGSASILALTLVLLWRDGSLLACIQQMIWLQQHYSAVNLVTYGAVNGGYSAILANSAGLELFIRSLVVLWIALPALIPVVALAWAAWRIRSGDRAPELILLSASTVALLISTAPRPDVTHLAYVMAVPFVLAFTAVARMRRQRVQGLLVAAFSIVALLSLPSWGSCVTERPVRSPIGDLRVARRDQPAISALLASVRPGDSLYVHPYLPLMYFLTQTRNPTRYSYLAPGMMTDREASDALHALQQQPPEWILYLHLDAKDYLRVFPAADASRVRYPDIEQWIADSYVPTGTTVQGYRLMHRAAHLAALKPNARPDD